MNALDKRFEQMENEGLTVDALDQLNKLVTRGYRLVVWSESENEVQEIWDRDFEYFRRGLSILGLKPRDHYYYEIFLYDDGHYSLDCRLTREGFDYLHELKQRKEATDDS